MKLVIGVLVFFVFALVILAPAVLMMVAAVRYKRNVEDASGWIILVAGILFSVLTLGILQPFVLAILLREPEKIAAASIVMAYAQPAITYLAVLLLGIGLWIRSGKLRSEPGRDRTMPQVQGQGVE